MSTLIEGKSKGIYEEKGAYNIQGIDWLYINIESKVFRKGRGGIALTKVVGDHAITFDEFVSIYNISKIRRIQHFENDSARAKKI